MNHLQHAYNDLILQTIDGVSMLNKRTGQHIKHKPGGHMLTVDLSLNVPILNHRQFNPYVAFAEAAWILDGSDSISWISKHTSIWNKFADNGKIKHAYGKKINNWFKALQILKTDNSSRQVVLNIFHRNDLDFNKELKPCPTQLILNVAEGKLYGQLVMRSSDLIVGLPYDIMTWALIIDAFAAYLELDRGELTMFLAHPHIYEKHIDKIDLRRHMDHYLNFPGLTPFEILKDKDEYVQYSKNELIRQVFMEKDKATFEVF